MERLDGKAQGCRHLCAPKPGDGIKRRPRPVLAAPLSGFDVCSQAPPLLP